MELRKTTFWHELIILILYFLLTPFAFGMMYPENISGDAGVIYLVPLFIVGITILISLIIIGALKWNIKGSKIELGYGLIPLVISSVTHHNIFSGDDSYATLTTTFFYSNTILLVGIYACSVFYKTVKVYLS